MSVGKGKPAGAIVIGGRKIAPNSTLSRIGVVAENEPSVVDGVGMLVQYDENPCWIAELRKFHVVPIGGTDGRVVPFVSHKSIH